MRETQAEPRPDPGYRLGSFAYKKKEKLSRIITLFLTNKESYMLESSDILQ